MDELNNIEEIRNEKIDEIDEEIESEYEDIGEDAGEDIDYEEDATSEKTTDTATDITYMEVIVDKLAGDPDCKMPSKQLYLDVIYDDRIFSVSEKDELKKKIGNLGLLSKKKVIKEWTFRYYFSSGQKIFQLKKEQVLLNTQILNGWLTSNEEKLIKIIRDEFVEIYSNDTSAEIEDIIKKLDDIIENSSSVFEKSLDVLVEKKIIGKRNRNNWMETDWWFSKEYWQDKKEYWQDKDESSNGSKYYDLVQSIEAKIGNSVNSDLRKDLELIKAFRESQRDRKKVALSVVNEIKSLHMDENFDKTTGAFLHTMASEQSLPGDIDCLVSSACLFDSNKVSNINRALNHLELTNTISRNKSKTEDAKGEYVKLNDISVIGENSKADNGKLKEILNECNRIYAGFENIYNNGFVSDLIVKTIMKNNNACLRQDVIKVITAEATDIYQKLPVRNSDRNKKETMLANRIASAFNQLKKNGILTSTQLEQNGKGVSVWELINDNYQFKSTKSSATNSWLYYLDKFDDLTADRIFGENCIEFISNKINPEDLENNDTDAILKSLGDDKAYLVDSIINLLRNMEFKDIVYLVDRESKILGHAIVDSNQSGVEYIDDKYRRKVNWRKWEEKYSPKEELEDTGGIIVKLTNQSLLKDLEQYRDKYFRMKKEDKKESVEYSEDDILKEVYLEKDELNKLIQLIEIKKNVILQGAPGVGKTFVAKRLAYYMMGKKDDDRIAMVQFHQSYSYEDFIAGYRPTEKGFKVCTGPFFDFCKKAREAYNNALEKDRREGNVDKYFFIIDEINRGNISKIFGELFMLIEKRGEELSILYYDKEKFSVPPNLYIIGMMNTADRSLAMMDYALRRRFAFYELVPAFCRAKGKTGIGKDSMPIYRHVENDAWNDYYKKVSQKLGNDKFKALIKRVQELNAEIETELGRGFRIGHSYFIDDHVLSWKKDKVEEWMQNIIDYELIPMLEEYWFEETEKPYTWSKRLNEALSNPKTVLDEAKKKRKDGNINGSDTQLSRDEEDDLAADDQDEGDVV